MQIVIDIPENYTKEQLSKANPRIGCRMNDLVIESLHNATILPENHGRLIDADKFLLYNAFQSEDEELGTIYVVHVDDITSAPTVIDARKREI